MNFNFQFHITGVDDCILHNLKSVFLTKANITTWSVLSQLIAIYRICYNEIHTVGHTECDYVHDVLLHNYMG